MSTTLLQHTQKIRGFQHRKYEYTTKNLIWVIRRKEFRCPKCGSLKITLRPPEQCLHGRIQQQDPMAHAPGIRFPRLLLSQIEDLSATLPPNSKGALSYGPKRRRGG